MRRILWVLVSLPACLLPVRAREEKFTLEQVMSAPFPSDLTASPTGNRIACVFDAQGKRNIWVAEGPSFAVHQLTSYSDADGQELSDLRFSTDGNTVVYVRGGEKNAAAQVPNPTSNPAGAEQAIWAIAWTGGAPRKIDAGSSPQISARGMAAYIKDGQIWVASLDGSAKPEHIVVRGQSVQHTWSPDGNKLVLVSARGDHSFIAIYDAPSKTLSYVAPSVDTDRFPKWSPDGRQIAFVRQLTTTRDAPEGFFIAPDQPRPWAIWVADVTTGQARPVWRSNATLEGSVPQMAGKDVVNWAAGDRIVFASEEDGWQHLYSTSSTSGTTTLLTGGECEFEHMVLTPDRRNIVYSSNCGDIERRHLWRVSATGGAPEQLTSGEGIEWSPTVTGDGRTIAYLASDARWPGRLFVRDWNSRGTGKQLAAEILPREFPAQKLVVPQAVLFTAADGMRIHGQVFLPGGAQPGGKLPAVIFLHGGPIRQMLLGWHYMYYYSNAYAMNQYLAGRGYIVLSVNYRSGIGYGRAFREAPARAGRGAAEYQDIVAAALYLRSRSEVDATRIGLWGGSYGGYLTAMGLARNSDLFAAGVDLHGVHDWPTDNWAGKNIPPELNRLAHESSPVASVGTWRSPVLLIHGDDDRNVIFTQTVDLVARLRKQGVEFEELIFPDEVHDFLLHRHWLAAYRAAADFFERRLTWRAGSRP